MMTPIELRHCLHQIPELMFNEFKTTALLLENISQYKNLKLGTLEGKKFGLHHPKFFPGDSIIQVGINIYKKILNSEISTS